MAQATRSKKPTRDAGAKPPETDKQTKPVERVIDPAHNTVEPYGKSEEPAPGAAGG